MKYIIVSNRISHERLAKNLANSTGCEFLFLSSDKDLDFNYIKSFKPEMIFFPHWSHKVPEEIYNNFECVIFHMTDLPYGRGGSPLQNLIVNGHTETMVSAIRCVRDIDAGGIYLKRPLSLAGTAREILSRASDIIQNMISDIIRNNLQPVDQVGIVTYFKRRRASDSDISNLTTLSRVYDYIRMLDADGYPRAFIKSKNIKIEFEEAIFDGQNLLAKAIIKIENS